MPQTDGTKSLLGRVLGYIETRGFQATSACELAPNVIAVADTLGDVDIYFYESKCRFTCPEEWVHHGDTSPGSCTSPFPGVGLLQGVGCFPAIKTLEAALSFAQHSLTLSEPISWHQHSQPLSVQMQTDFVFIEPLVELNSARGSSFF